MNNSPYISITHSVFLTGIDKAASSFNNGVFDKLSFQIKPYHVPSEKWMSTFLKELGHPKNHFSITTKGVCYLNIENISVKTHEVQNFVNNINSIVKKINIQMGNEIIVESMPVKDTNLVINADISAILDSIEW